MLIGDGDVEVTGVLTALDCTLEVNEAIEKGYIISHHPLIFKGVPMKLWVTGSIIRKLIQHDINLIAMHTNLDDVNPYGVDMMLAKAMGLKNISIKLQDVYYKVQTYGKG